MGQHIWRLPFAGGSVAFCANCGVPLSPDNRKGLCLATHPVGPQRDTTTIADVAASLRRIEELITQLVQYERDRQ